MKRKIRILKSFFLIFLIVTLLFLIFLPFLCDTYLLPRLLEPLPFNQKELSISRVSPWKIRGTLRLMQDDVLVASIPRFEIHYSPSSLLKGQLDTILLDSPTVNLSYIDKTLVSTGLPPKTSSTGKQSDPFSLALPIAVETIIIRNGHIALQTEATTIDLAIDAKIHLGFWPRTEQSYQLTSMTAHISTGGDLELYSQTTGTFTPQGMLFNTEVNVPNLHDLGKVIPGKQKALPTGALTMKGQVTLDAKMRLTGYQLTAAIDSLTPSPKGGLFTQTSAERAIQIRLEGDTKSLTYSLSGLSSQQPYRLDLGATGAVQLSDNNYSTTLIVHSSRLDQPLTVALNGSFDLGDLLADLQLTSDAFTIDKRFSVGPLKINGICSYKKEKITAKITGSIATIKDAVQDLTLADISWEMPIQLPLGQPLNQPQKQKKGWLKIQSIRYKGVDTATVGVGLQQISNGISFTTNLRSQLEIEAELQCTGSAYLNGDATGSCTLADTSIDTQRLPSYINTPEDTTFTGNISAEATFEFIDKKPSGRLTLRLANGELTSDKTTITGIATQISFPDLPHIRSAPGQLASIDLIESGRVKLHNGHIFFRIENEQQLFLEKARFSWCGGKIETGSLTLGANMNKLEATLYCDRLNFSELLKQFGVEDTEGQGSLNGRLPIKISERGIHFDDGFLFSTPGTSGIVRFNNTQQLRQGMPAIGQTATLDYSMKALNNFAYNWTKLSFTSEQDDLLLTIEIDGKPAEPLPFGYKDGQIVATDKGPGLQHPIRLDMNFRLPLQNLFRYGKSLQSLMEKM